MRVVIVLILTLSLFHMTMVTATNCETDPSKCETNHQIDPTCHVSEWSNWSNCTVTCGDHGVQYRTRTILSKHQVEHCPTLKQERECNKKECPSDCKVTQWSDWSTCSLSCGGGQRVRIRDVEKPAVGKHSAQCRDLSEWEDCNTQVCGQGCEFSAWSEWGNCTSPCGSGQQTRTRKLVHSGNSSWCGEITQQRSCNTHLCPVSCVASPWSTWSTCSQSCGKGYMTRSRQIMQEALNGGDLCGDLLEYSACNEEPCPIDCVVSDWVEPTCPDQCNGSLLKKRHIIVQPSNGGNACPILEENIPCSDHCHVGLQGLVSSHNDNGTTNNNHTHNGCFYSNWTNWTPCETTACGSGITYRTRTVLNVKDATYCTNIREEATCEEPQCATDCQVNEWSEWSECSEPCGEGKQHRTRSIISQSTNGGRLCPELHQTRDCNAEACHLQSECDQNWSEWSPCSKSCGGGLSTRTRPSKNTCSYLQETMTCNTQPCTPWTVSDWSEWSECNAPCNGGQRQRTRSIVQVGIDSNQIPQLVEFEACNTMKCHPADVSEWSEWSKCNKECGGGLKERTRTLIQAPLGPMYNVPQLKEEIACNQDACPIDCTVSLWSEWSDCNNQCIQRRVRTIITPAQNNGIECPNLEMFRECEKCNTDKFEHQPKLQYPSNGYGWDQIGWDWEGSHRPYYTPKPVEHSSPTNDPNHHHHHHHHHHSSPTNEHSTPSMPHHHELPQPPKECYYTQWTEWSVCEDGCLQTRVRTVESPTDIVQTHSQCEHYTRQKRPCPSCSKSVPNQHEAFEGNWNWNHLVSTVAKQGKTANAKPRPLDQQIEGAIPVTIDQSNVPENSLSNKSNNNNNSNQKQQQPSSDVQDALNQPMIDDKIHGKFVKSDHDDHNKQEDHEENNSLKTNVPKDKKIDSNKIVNMDTIVNSVEENKHEEQTKHAEKKSSIDKEEGNKIDEDKDGNTVEESSTVDKKVSIPEKKHNLKKVAKNPNVQSTFAKLLGGSKKKKNTPPIPPIAPKLPEEPLDLGNKTCNDHTCECKGEDWSDCKEGKQQRIVATVNHQQQCVHTQEERACCCETSPCETHLQLCDHVKTSSSVIKLVPHQHHHQHQHNHEQSQHHHEQSQQVHKQQSQQQQQHTTSGANVKIDNGVEEIEKKHTPGGIHIVHQHEATTISLKPSDHQSQQVVQNNQQTHQTLEKPNNKNTKESNPCASNPCQANEECHPDPKMCITIIPCPQYKCIKKTQINPCMPNPCNTGEKCEPEPKTCVKAPCPQYKCTQITNCEYKIQPWSSCQPKCGCKAKVCKKFKKRTKVAITNNCEEVHEIIPCGSISFLQTWQSRMHRAAKDDFDAFENDMNEALKEERMAESISSGTQNNADSEDNIPPLPYTIHNSDSCWKQI